MAQIVTFTSDFGVREYYVGAVKGAILSVCESARIVDISHQISPHELCEAAFTLASACPYYPPGSIHLAVVDPGVGSRRRSLAVATERDFFVGPDNGIFTLILEQQRVRQVVSLENERFFHTPVAPTFHGRDVFGPVAGWLARGTALLELGPSIDDWVRLDFPAPERSGQRLLGKVLQVDRFGNVITCFRPSDLEGLAGGDGEPLFRLGNQRVTRVCRFYSEARPGELFALIGSSGYYELALAQDSAATRLGARPGTEVVLELR